MTIKKAFKTLNHCTFNLKVHLVLVTKYRKRCISKPMLLRLQEICSRLCEQWECELLEFNGEPDHLHLLLDLNPKVTPSVFVNNLKTVSSRLIRKEFAAQLRKVYWKPIFCSRSYCILSCEGALLTILKQYIEQQAAPLK